MKSVLILASSPRRDGNSYRLANAARRGAQEAGNTAELLFVDDYVRHFLRDCRQCRGKEGECTLEDRFSELFLEHYLPADGIIFATPLYWYGMSGQLKTFLDRSFCYYAASHSNSAENASRMAHKKIGLTISSEESYPAAPLGVVHSIQEFCRYNQCDFVGVVQGIGNKRGDVESDPAKPIDAAFRLGANLFNTLYTDYRMETERRGSVWDNAIS
ncbi:MAG: flavodoxin family protein [Verrucomicrobiaceae bacterium]|nr:flavodoxin family protein [Verrucomicrobiaceae bacterium]NCF91566.1 flavodoxin family protein [Verrucomicrobiaceae bacterium]